jgi:hypothetical protein
MEIIDTARGILESAGYETGMSISVADGFVFEDANVYGFLATLPADAILNGWEERQDSFVRQQAAVLSRVPSKAWNVYAVFLTSDNCTAQLKQAFASIEEDFRSARKIVRCGVRTRDALQRALAPLLPLQYAQPIAAVDIRSRVTNDPAISQDLREMIERGVAPSQITIRLLEGQ